MVAIVPGMMISDSMAPWPLTPLATSDKPTAVVNAPKSNTNTYIRLPQPNQTPVQSLSYCGRACDTVQGLNIRPRLERAQRRFPRRDPEPASDAGNVGN